MNAEDKILDLLIQYEAQLQSGQQVDINQLAGGNQKLAEKIKQNAQRLSKTDWVKQPTENSVDGLESPSQDTLKQWMMLPESTTKESLIQELQKSELIEPGVVERVTQQENIENVYQLSDALIKEDKLTAFQLRAISQGKSKSLQLGKYHILEKIGEGGMGSVYKARHSVLDRVVALKVLPRESKKNKATIARFLREVRTVAKLSHPNIVAANDSDEAHGYKFLVMEYVEGQDLSSTVKRGGVLPVSKAVDYIIQTAKGLEYAHQEGIIHRDIKPANLLLDTNETVKILDMGLARLEDPGEEDSELTQQGSFMGTVDYMPPEQAIDTRTADRRADIYSLGGTLHFLLNGKPPFQGDTMLTIILGHREQAPPDLSQLRSDVPPQLNIIFQRLMAKSVDERYQTAAEVVAALEAIKPMLESFEQGVDPTAAVTPMYQPEFDTSGQSHTAFPPGSTPGQPAPMIPGMPVPPVPQPIAPLQPEAPASIVVDHEGSTGARRKRAAKPSSSTLVRALIGAGFVLGNILLFSLAYFAFRSDSGNLILETEGSDFASNFQGKTLKVINSETEEEFTITLDQPESTIPLMPGDYTFELADNSPLKTPSNQFTLSARADLRIPLRYQEVVEPNEPEVVPNNQVSSNTSNTPPANNNNTTTNSNNTPPNNNQRMVASVAQSKLDNWQRPVPFGPNNGQTAMYPSLYNNDSSLAFLTSNIASSTELNQRSESTFSNNKWEDQRRISLWSRTNTPVCISKDGLKAFVTKHDNNTGKNKLIELSRPGLGFRWPSESYIQQQSVNINTDGNQRDAHLSEDNMVLIFSGDHSGSEGSYDLWMCMRKTPHSWTAPVSLGPHINSEHEEFSPTVSPDGLTLCFGRRGFADANPLDSELWIATRNSRTAPWNRPYKLALASRQAQTGGYEFTKDGSSIVFHSKKSQGAPHLLMITKRSGSSSNKIAANSPPRTNSTSMRSYSIDQILGPPNTDGYGDKSSAWVSASADNQEEWVMVEFENEVEPRQLSIYENYNPGAVTKVTGLVNNSETVLWQGVDPTPTSAPGGVSRINISRPNEKFKRYKVYLDCTKVPGWNEIDTIGLLGANGSTQWPIYAQASSDYSNKSNSTGFVSSTRLSPRGMQSGPLISEVKGDSTGTKIVSTRVLEELSSSFAGDYAPSLSPDGLTIIWTREGGTIAEPEVWGSSRLSTQSTFTNPQVIQAGLRFGTASSNGLELYAVQTSGNGTSKILRATRNFISTPFGPFTPVEKLLRVSRPQGIVFNSSSKHLIFERFLSGSSDKYQFAIASRDSTKEELEAPTKVLMEPHPIVDSQKKSWPSLANNDLTLWFCVGEGRNTNILRATRKTVDEPFSNYKFLTKDGKKVSGCSPRFVDATGELFYAVPNKTDERGIWQIVLSKVIETDDPPLTAEPLIADNSTDNTGMNNTFEPTVLSSTDLLTTLDPKDNALSGTWVKNDTSFTLQAGTMGAIEIPVEADSSFILTADVKLANPSVGIATRFVSESGNEFSILLCDKFCQIETLKNDDVIRITKTAQSDKETLTKLKDLFSKSNDHQITYQINTNKVVILIDNEEVLNRTVTFKSLGKATETWKMNGISPATLSGSNNFAFAFSSPGSEISKLKLADVAATSSTTSVASNPSRPSTTKKEGSKNNTITNIIGMHFSKVPSGKMRLGRSTSMHEITISKSFFIGTVEVTQAQYLQVTGTNPSYRKFPNNPVENMTYNEAVEFCRLLSSHPKEKAAGRVYRLPTAAEWEYACRAGSTTQYCYGDSISQLFQYAWYRSNSPTVFPGSSSPRAVHHPVGQLKPNGFGLYDMHGNVSELCSNYWYATRAETDPTNSVSTSRMLRGGNYYDDTGDCTSDDYTSMSEDSRYYYAGFRVVIDPVLSKTPQ